MSAKAFSAAVYKRMNWRRAFRFRFKGVQRTRNGLSILLFDLSEPQILVGKCSAHRRFEGETQFISFQNEEGQNVPEFKPDRAFVAYPVELAGNTVGISYALRERIKRLENTITEDDIKQAGIQVSNSMFGDIPEREQMLSELQSLLESM